MDPMIACLLVTWGSESVGQKNRNVSVFSGLQRNRPRHTCAFEEFGVDLPDESETQGESREAIRAMVHGRDIIHDLLHILDSVITLLTYYQYRLKIVVSVVFSLVARPAERPAPLRIGSDR